MFYKKKDFYPQESKTNWHIAFMVIVIVAGFSLLLLFASSASKSSKSPPRRTISYTSKIRQLVSKPKYRHAVSIEKAIQNSSLVSTIEYNFSPWLFVPNETIAEQVVYKIVCAVRKEVKHDLRFIGHVRLVDDYGKSFTAPHVEIHLSKEAVGRLSCSGEGGNVNVNWEKIAKLYTTHSLPDGAKLKYAGT